MTSEDREEREERFRTGDLPLLFCSPTMELGVDIAQLNLVNLRNVPPTPANYAQRSGRAGRGGQPALVFTYCAGRSPHDQYFFREPSKMVAGVVAGEVSGFRLASVSGASLAGWLYLIVIGSWVGFASYSWLLGHARTSLVSTYAYVNPVVAVFLGWSVLGESVTWRTLLAAALIVSAVALIVLVPGARAPDPDVATGRSRP